MYLPLGSGTGTLGCSSLPLWIRTVAHYKKKIFIYLWFDVFYCTFTTKLERPIDQKSNPLFQVPPGLWQGSGYRPRWPPERVQTWLVTWWETGPWTSMLGRHQERDTTGPPSSLSAESSTAVVTSSSANRETPSEQPLWTQKVSSGCRGRLDR